MFISLPLGTMRIKSGILFFLAIFICSVNSFGNKPSSEIYVGLQKFASLKKVLYIAAHPDDENTRALAWFSLGHHARTAYLSLTRGDGGQNLIGNELDEDLGILRTHELLAARSYDKAEQYFSRAVDFGYSKTADESFEKWGKDLILEDVVLMIRKLKPDVIITRFPPDERGGHGHHTASALLAIEAFKLAADSSYRSEQVKKYGTWQAASLYWNASTWANPNLEKDALNNPNYFIADIGGYNQLLGKSYNEIGTIARSQHKCQGFGAIVEKGSSMEYFEYLGGKKISHDFFEHSTESWEKTAGKNFSAQLQQILKSFHFAQPEKNVPALLKLKNSLEKLPESEFKIHKLNLLNEIIIDCLGLDIEITAADYVSANGDRTKFSVQLINRSGSPLELVSFKDKTVNKTLTTNTRISEEIEVENKTEISIPYWIKKPYTNAYIIENEEDLLKAVNETTFVFPVSVKAFGSTLNLEIPAEYKWRDPAYGERRRDVISSPVLSANFNSKILILKPGQTKKAEIRVHGFKENISDELTLELPTGWKAEPSVFPVQTKNKHQEVFFNFEITATEESERGFIKIKNKAGEYLHNLTEITYDHIPYQAYFKPAELECIKLDAEIISGKVAYIKGAEDEVPQAIAQLGFDVKVFEVKDLSSLDLNTFQSVVLGIRIYNVYPELKNFTDKLFDFVQKGGNLIMQYNTVSRFTPNEKFGGPVPFEITRFRVTEEDAAVTFLKPNHPLLTSPNQLNLSDFDNWIQERGLYFAGNWDTSYIPVFSWHDKGEDEQTGALIVNEYGKGRFMYTGISFFRLLPAGVEGAYRLFANMLSYKYE